MAEAALKAHIVAQTQANISFLQAQGYLSVSDATDIQTKLANTSVSRGTSSAMPTPTPPVPQPYHAPPQSQPQSSYQPSYQSPPPSQFQPLSVPPVSSYPPPPQDNVQRARAIWAYNEDQREPNDLTFSAGEVIEIVKEVNSDWWEGRARGRLGLFPSNYVEKMASDPEKRAYKPFMAAYHGSDIPPPVGAPVTNSVGLQEDPGQEKKKSKFNGLGNTLAHSAAGGVGFGAGMGLVSAIF